MSDSDTGPDEASASKTSPDDPPASNQGRDEPVPTTPDESGQAEAQGESGDPGESRESGQAATMPQQISGGVPTPGDSQGVSVPAVHAAAGSSEQADAVQDVSGIALAAPGKPDGEVDTRG